MRAWVAGIVLTGLGAACSTSAERAIERGNTLSREGQLEEARAAYAAACEAAPDSARAHLLLGNTLMSLKKPEAAEREWQAAASLDGAREALALVALSSADAGAALEWVANLPSSNAKVIKARALLALGQPTEALSTLEGVTGVDAIYLRGSALIVLGRFADAEAMFEALRRDAPKSSLGPYGLARLAAAQNRAADALLYLKSAKATAQPKWDAAAVAADPAFAFLSASADYKELLKPLP